MDYSQLSLVLSNINAKSVYLRFKPDVLDFTDFESPVEISCFIGQNESFSILLNEDNIFLTLSMLRLTLFEGDMKIVVWDWKSFASYVKFLTKQSFDVNCSIIDLKILESYGGIKLGAPATFVECMNRLRHLISSGLWNEMESVYRQIHIPLMKEVLPAIETTGVIDPDQQSIVYSHYEIDGQENGRLRSFDAFKHGFLPHAMKPEKRDILKPINLDQIFMMFDFKGMEVYMLAWMSKDPLLQKLCREEDIYSELYRCITSKQPQTKEDRDFAKKCFLPHIYGQSAYSLSQRCGVAMDIAEMVVERIGSLFPTALAFVADSERQLRETGCAKDIFGKRRTNFESGKEYLVRNFCVQAPAAMICSEKLISLYYALKDITSISYTVHDGFVVYATKENWKQVYKTGYDVLTGESLLCPGLRLKVACRAGRNLNSLKPVMKKGKDA